MLDKIVARYDDMLGLLGLDTFAFTVTVPDSGILTVEDAVRRLGFDPAALLDSGEPHSGHDLSLYQVGTGIVTLNWTNPYDDLKQVTDRLAGDGFRHWYLSYDIEGNTVIYARYGETEGCLEYPEPGWFPFTPPTDYFGPLRHYSELLLSAYDTEEAEAQVDVNAACLAVIEAESGVRFDEGLLDSPPHSVLPISM
ncbi:hypothetical protein [Sphaerimonospora mesophila]|uniref:hypothetical protein n=1 Tax=Sphaerimonospora mesophila TaxID=37483 RepID=UPI0006E2C2B2